MPLYGVKVSLHPSPPSHPHLHHHRSLRINFTAADSQAHCYASTDVLEGVAAVREKRPADFYTKRK